MSAKFDMIKLGNYFLRSNSGKLEGSTDKVTWKQVFAGGLIDKELKNNALVPGAGQDGYALCFVNSILGYDLLPVAVALKANANINEAGSAWFTNTNYVQTISVSGASLGDTVSVVASEGVMANVLSAVVNFSILAWVSAPNTVTVFVRTAGYVAVPTGAKYYVCVHK